MPILSSFSRVLILTLFCTSLLFGTTVGFAADNKINVNTATAAQLESLKGIGPELAERILDYKKEKGDFKSIDELGNVKGIGEKKLTQFQDAITVKKPTKKK